LVGIDRPAARLLSDAQRIERGKRVRPELDAGADLAKLRRLFQHLDRKALAHQGQRGCQAADAAAGDQYGKGFRSLLHVVSNRRGAASYSGLDGERVSASPIISSSAWLNMLDCIFQYWGGREAAWPSSTWN